MEITIQPDDLRALRERIKPYLKEKRYSHTLEVEEEAARIGAVYLPHKIGKLRISALLHDITKRAPLEKQLQYCEEFGIMLNAGDVASPKVFHAITAAALARRDFADTVDEEIISGIRWHTTGCDRMSLFSAIVYLADYIEPSRTFHDCVTLRDYFWGEMPDGEDQLGQTIHFCKTMVLSFDLTIQNLIRDGEPICADTVLARNCFLDRLESLKQV
jgi:nicotinate-nucleotide adenylyltransferase